MWIKLERIETCALTHTAAKQLCIETDGLYVQPGAMLALDDAPPGVKAWRVLVEVMGQDGARSFVAAPVMGVVEETGDFWVHDACTYSVENGVYLVKHGDAGDGLTPVESLDQATLSAIAAGVTTA